MKKKAILPITIAALLFLGACNNNSSVSDQGHSALDVSISSVTDSSSVFIDDTSAGSYYSSVSVPTYTSISEPSNSGTFSLTTKDGQFSQSGNVYTLTKAGTYTAKGVLEEGQIVVQAGEDDVVELNLEGATITNSSDSPIKALTGDKLEVSAKAETQNLIKDLRNVKTVDNEEVGEGAINAKIDLKIKGSGTLVVVGNYNNGIHTSDDLTIQKLTLQATAVNNALKGNDSITIKSGTINAISTNGQGIKTKNTDVSSKGNQRGTIEIDGGTIYVDSLYDGIEASYNVVINQTDDTVPTNITVKSGTKSSNYKASTFDKTGSAKGIKADNEITINKGTIVLSNSDDAIHANYGDTFDNGEKGLGNITINGGSISIASGDDGLHADNTLNIAGGYIAITGATEGLEANHIKISGGETHVYGTDDGVNASKKINQTPSIDISGGVLDVSVSNGDTDGIDSNGNYTQTGGVVISRGSPGAQGSGMSTGLDCDGTASISGGTFIAFNGMEKTPTTTSSVLKAATQSNSSGGFPGGGGGPGGPGGGGPGGRFATTYSFVAGNYTLTGTDLNLSFTNNYTYGSFTIYSSALLTNNTYTLAANGSAVLSWTQSSSSVTIG